MLMNIVRFLLRVARDVATTLSTWARASIRVEGFRDILQLRQIQLWIGISEFKGGGVSHMCDEGE